MIDISSKNQSKLTETTTESDTKTPIVQPKRNIFNATIASWESAATNFGARSDAYDKATKRSLELLNQLKSLYRDTYDPECMPNRETYMKGKRLRWE